MLDMAKKRATSSGANERAGAFYGVRCSDDDAALFEHIAKLEGFSTVTQWMLVHSRKRARMIQLAAEKGESITISEVVAVPEKPKT